ncbi:MliC family protein [Dyella humi]|uniref:MliC family protein n=1 Tax=Dyella humi TaxID=1770547 RepID=A0ABW8IL27_9GAMM
MVIKYSLTAAWLLVLGGCASAPSDHEAAAWMNYTCSDERTLQARYPDPNTAVIRIQDETHTLHIAISGSGARYTGEGWQWWTKGMHDGMLAPLATGESIASAPGVQCHAD